MEDPQSDHDAPVRPSGRPPRGESVPSAIGAMVGLILFSSLAASAWWMFQDWQKSTRRERTREIAAVTGTLARSGELLLAAGELSSLRRVVVETGREYGLTRCRITLLDGRILADSDPTQINVPELPAQWPTHVAVTSSADDGDECIAKTSRLLVPGKGAAQLEIAGKLDPGASVWEAEAGMGVISSAALVLFLMVYRKIRSRLRSVGAIREALLTRSGGQKSASVLTVAEDLGPEAASWNELLGEHDRLERALQLEHAKAALNSRGGARRGLEGACDAMSEGLVLLNDDLSVQYVNGAAAAFLRSTTQEVVGTPIEKFIQAEGVVEAIRFAVSGTVRRPATVDVDDAEADVALRFRVRPVRREDSVAAMMIIEDVTQKRLAERATNAFVAQATHELRTPLTNIRLYLETAMEGGEKDVSQLTDCLNIINQESRRLERMVGDILSVAEIEAGSVKLRRDDVRLESLFPRLESHYRAQAQDKGIALLFDIPPKLPVIQGDDDKLMLALHNLVGNALKYTASGGQVKVSVEVRARELTIEVADTGLGMSEADLARIFEKFYRSEDPRVVKTTGSGLGLALAREVARLHGGDIAVRSELNEGSSFTLTVPMTDEEAA